MPPSTLPPADDLPAEHPITDASAKTTMPKDAAAILVTTERIS
jgi:hypothetical protein